MNWLFVENFRGFERQFIPLEDVNFFIGENSTGKTSILALLNLFASQQFWFTLDFNAEECQLGNYRDIANFDSDFFRIGFIQCLDEHSKDLDKNVLSFLMEFKEKDGVPSISRYCFISEAKAFQVAFTDGKIKYTYNVLESGEQINVSIRKVFESWVASDVDITSFKDLPIPPVLHVRLPVILSLISEEITLKNKRSSKESLGRFLRILQLPYFANAFTWIAPVRSKPKRTYDQIRYTFSPEGDHTPYLIKKIIEDSKGKKGKAFKDFIQIYGKECGLMKDIKIKILGDGPASPFQLMIVLDDKEININNVGYGVNQILPVMVELFARPNNAGFAIQQPEVHLHPRAQAALGDVFYNLAVNDGKKFFIETHSDFIIDRFRLNINRGNKSESKGKNKKNIGSQVIFFERTNGVNKASIIRILPNGKYSEDQPDSFQKFFIKEELSILGIR